MADENDPTEIVVETDSTITRDDVSVNSNSKKRFQKITKKLINVNRILISEDKIWSIGQDPGIDAKNVDYDIQTQCRIFCSDYGEEKAFETYNLTNKTLSDFLSKKRPEGGKVRWINVDGISWDVIKELALRYDLHPLCVEDIIQCSQRTKMDQYHNHIYVSLILHILEENDEIKNLDKGDSIYDGRVGNQSDSRMSLLDHGHRQGSSYLEAHRALRKMKLSVVIEQVNIILLPDDTLITIFQHSGKSVYKLILERINQPKTILRASKDASLLMEAVIDTIVDLAIPIIDSYRHQIYEVEGKLLIQPKMNYMHELHMITGELTLLKKTLAPIKGLVTILRKHSDENSLITPSAKVYFSDVSDHCADIVDNLETMIKMGENLVNMIFNLIAYETNENMKTLAFLSLVFLPMTFIAGYYGMNFVTFDDLDKPISYFWKATGISTGIIVILFSYGYWSKWILSFRRYLQNKKLRRKLRTH
ncbi:hypothetical protein Glove_99g125 [Diversispora epigaea]|uniref:Magnesium transport protein CorA n=1 Tax=Diversispora epigaea TaxID=1348612 RepID=A0A397JEQ0_9GLOM|nr:hypothetical protein Glove_99g126 [Diversispora epigaea]RHZ83143.1 hypothetical protein Glove_99g125 [Diversispora epigaea]